MPRRPQEGCAKHDRAMWWRLAAGSELTPPGEHGIWTCAICHTPPEPLLKHIEWFDEEEDGVLWDAQYQAFLGHEPHVVGQVKASTLNLGEAQALFEKWKGEEYGWVKARILTLARIHGEYHADMMIGVELESPNMIGAAVNALARGGYLEKLNRQGEVEHRQTASGTSRRASYVWRLSAKGRDTAAKLRKALGDSDRLPGPKRSNVIDGQVSRDGRTIQGVLDG